MQRGAFNTGSERSFAQGPFRMFGANKDVLCLQAETSECHKSRRTLVSPQERKIDWRTPNQLKMKHISPSLNP